MGDSWKGPGHKFGGKMKFDPKKLKLYRIRMAEESGLRILAPMIGLDHPSRRREQLIEPLSEQEFEERMGIRKK